MGLSDTILQLKDKFTGAVSNFFYPRDEYPRDERTAPRHERRVRNTRENANAPRAEEYDAYSAPAEGQEGAWTGPQVRESSPYQNTNPYQAPDRSRAPQNAYQAQNAYQPQGQTAQQQQYQSYAPQGAYQQPQQQPQPEQTAQGQDANILFFPNSQQPQREMSARVITARSVADCYSAITQLRLGDMVILVMDGISDPSEMRHYVDMLSGACYSLRATITKLSRHGAYLICPAQIRVYVDAATNQLNSGARQPQRPLQNSYAPRYASPLSYSPYGAEAGRAQGSYEPSGQHASPDGAYAAGAAKDYYGRSAMPDARGTADHLQPYANGYMPDSPMEESRAL